MGLATANSYPIAQEHWEINELMVSREA